MNWRQWSQRDWKAEFDQLYQQLPVSLLNKAFALLLVVFLAWQASQLTWLVVPAPVATPSAVTASTAQTANPAVSQQIEQIVAAQLFGKYQEKAKAPVVQAVTTDAPKTNLNLKLTGVVSTSKDHPEQGAAVIENNGVELAYAVDEQIEGSPAVLKQVLDDRVIISVNGRMETLMLDGVEYQRLSAANAPIQEGQVQEFVPDASAQVEQVGPEPTPDIRREVMDQPTKLFDYINISPRNRNGQMYGYALTPKREPEIFNRFGLKPNDVAIEINGVRLNDMQAAYGVIAELRDASQATIKVERDGEIRDVVINLSQ